MRRRKIEVDLEKLRNSDELIVRIMNDSLNILRKTAQESDEDFNDFIWPIVIPSYNRPDNKFAGLLRKHNSIWPVIYVVRESQRKDYEKALSDLSNVQICSFADEKINSAAKAREKILQLPFHHVFMFDDDIKEFYFSHSYFNALSTTPKSPKHKVKTYDFDAMMGAWQLLMMWTEEYYSELNIFASFTGSHVFQSFQSKKELVEVGKGEYVAMGLNSKLVRKSNIHYDPECVLEDVDFDINCMLHDLVPIKLLCFGFDNGNLSEQNWACTVAERMSKGDTYIRQKYSDSLQYYHVRYIKTPEKILAPACDYKAFQKAKNLTNVYLPNSYIEEKLKKN